MSTTDKNKLDIWKRRFEDNKRAYDKELSLMDNREELYRGDNSILAVVDNPRKKKTPHVRNIVAELIEAQVDSGLPQPKVTARRQKDELKAKLIEDMLRNEMDRIPFEQINDMMERTVPIQGGGGYLIEWDNTERTHFTVGELAITTLHPKQIIPQAGVFSGIEDMDYIFVTVPQTKEYIRQRYGVNVEDESESEPEAKSSDDQSMADDIVTQYIAYYRNDKGGIGVYSWVNDVELEDMDDFQARIFTKCNDCGTIQPPDADDNAPCPVCGGKHWIRVEEEEELLPNPIIRSDGSMVGGMVGRQEIVEDALGDFGLPQVRYIEEPKKVPYYKPNIYPIILQKNVSEFGRFLGGSDIDKIAGHQNTTNRIEGKIIDKLVKSGSIVTLPPKVDAKVDEVDMKPIRLRHPQDKSMLDVINLQASIAQDLSYLEQVYQEARQIIGITDSFQGRKDATATSGKAKEFAAAQSAGRLESKRVMKDAAYASLFEAMFKYKLAYADEPRSVVSEDIHGEKKYDVFNRYDFLEEDENGELYWNDQFLFSCDTSAPLASNREAMWQETRMNLQTGAFGDPTQLTTLILFWTKMEQLHYPGAGDTKTYLEEELQRQNEAQAMQTTPQMPGQGADMMQAQQGPQDEQRGSPFDGLDPQTLTQILAQAKADAERDHNMGLTGQEPAPNRS